MAKSIPTTYSATTVSDYATGEQVRNTDWSNIVAGQHFHHSRSLGFATVGKSFEPVATTTNGSYNDTGAIGELQWTSEFHRLTNNSGNLRYRIWLVIIGEQIDVRLNVRDPGGLNTTVAATKSGAGFARAVGVIDTLASGAGPKIFDLSWRQNTGGAGTGSLAQVLIAEEPYTDTAYLPTGR